MRSHVLLVTALLVWSTAQARPQEPVEPPPPGGELAQQPVPPPPEITDMARKFYDAGATAYEKGDYPTALRAFEAAWATLPQPEFQFNIARCHERLGHWGLAASAYQQYLAAKPGAQDADEIRLRIAELFIREREAEAARAALHPAPPPARPSRSVRIAAYSLLGATLALGAAGTGAYFSEWSEYQSKRDACMAMCAPGTLDGLRTRVEIAQTAGGVLWGLAGAALVADVILWIVDAKQRREHAPASASRNLGWRF